MPNLPVMDRISSLELTEEQQAEITSLRAEHYKTVTPLKNKMAELRAHERTLLSEESVDMKAVNKTIDEQTELSNSIRKLQVKQQVAIKGLLSDEQVMKLQQRRQFAQGNGSHGKSGRQGVREDMEAPERAEDTEEFRVGEYHQVRPAGIDLYGS